MLSRKLAIGRIGGEYNRIFLSLPLHLSTSKLAVSIDFIIMVSRSRETSIDQHISGVTATDGARIFAGTNTTNNIYNGWYTLPEYKSNCEINA